VARVAVGRGVLLFSISELTSRKGPALTRGSGSAPGMSKRCFGLVGQVAEPGAVSGGSSLQSVLASQGAGQTSGGLPPSIIQQRVGVDLSALLSLSAGRGSLVVPAATHHPALLRTGDAGHASSSVMPPMLAHLPLAAAHGAHQPLGIQHQQIQRLQLAATQPTQLGGALLAGSIVDQMHGLSLPMPGGHLPPASLLGATRPARMEAGRMWSSATAETGGFCMQGHRTGHLLANLSSDETESHNSEASRPSEASGSSDGSDSGDKKCRAWKIMLTAQQAVQIYKQMPADSLHITSKSVIVGKQYGVSAKTIRDIWKRETWVKATRHVWSEADEKQYRQEEKKSLAASASQPPPPGSVASLLSDDVERSPSPHAASAPANGSVGPSRSRGRPKGVKDSRPRKRRCMSASVAAEMSGRDASVTSTSSQATWSLSPAPGSRSPSCLGDVAVPALHKAWGATRACFPGAAR
jgi:hypothetical protein